MLFSSGSVFLCLFVCLIIFCGRPDVYSTVDNESKFFLTLGDSHSFPFRPLVLEVHVNLVEVGLCLKFVVPVVPLSAPKSSKSSNDDFCLWYRLIYKKVLSKSVLCWTFNLSDWIWICICTATQRECAFCSTPSCMPMLFLLDTC